MVTINGYTATPHQRSNRRRERPGSRTRRTITRKSNIQSEYKEGLLDALDCSVPLPSDRSRPSPLVRQNWDQSWQRWQARQAEEKALVEMDKLQLEMEQQRLLFGDFVDEDDELYRLGILYNDEDDARDNRKTSFVSCGRPFVEQSPPLFVIRQGKPRRNRRPKWQSIPLLLSLSNLRDDTDIARLLSPPIPGSNTMTIQHRETPTLASPTVATHNSADIPLSLPITSASGSSISAHGSNALITRDNTPTFPPHSLDNEDWTFINDATFHTPTLQSPASETETWILLSDDS